MIPITQLIANIKDYLSARSSVPDQDYSERKAHFDKILQLLEDKNYTDLTKEIEYGIEYFHHYFSSNRYSDSLVELKKHFVPDNAQDAEQRLRKLLAAVLNNNEKDLAKVLDNGGLAVINASYQGEESIGVTPGSTPLMAAFITKNFSIFGLLFKELDIISQQHALDFLLHESSYDENNPNPIINARTNYRLLHFAAENGMPSLLSLLLKDMDSANFNKIDNNNRTALYLACQKEDIEAVDLLLSKNADPDKGKSDTSPLMVSIYANNDKLVNKLLKHGASLTRLTYHLVKEKCQQDNKYQQVFDTINQHYQSVIKPPFVIKKEQIIKTELLNRSFFALNKIAKSSIEDTLISQLYFENASTKNTVVDQLRHLLNSKDDILKPLFTIIDMASNTQTEKKMKTIVNNDKHIGSLIMGGERGAGVYRGKASVYIAGNSGMSALGSILHEWKHFTDKAVFGDRNTAFPASLEADFYLIKESVRKNLKLLPEEPNDLRNIKNSFRAVFDIESYDMDSQNVELLARIPEVFGTLNMKRGRAYLEKYMPELLNFYAETYNTCCKNYINSKVNPQETNPSFIIK